MKYNQILITGGAGFIGSHLCQLLLQQKQRVRIFDLPHVSFEHLPSHELDVFRGDICKKSELREASEGCDLIIHLAGNPNLWAPNEEIFETVHHQGTQNVLEVANSLQVKKVIYVSTESILIPGHQEKTITETTKTKLKDMIGPYCKSKWLAEEAVRLSQAKGQNITILSPTIPIGAKDYHMGPLTRVIRDFCQGKIKAYMNGVINVIDVHDIAEGIWTAANYHKPAYRFLLGHENWTILELFKHLALITGNPIPKHKIPYPLALSFAWLDEKLCPWLLQRPPVATITGVKLSHHSKPFDATHTMQQLDLTLRPCYDALKEMVQWMQTDKII